MQSEFSFAQTGLFTLILVSLFRYLILDNIRAKRANSKKLKIKKEVSVSGDPNTDEDAFLFDFDDEEVRPIEILKSLLKEKKCDLMTNEEILLLVKEGLIRPRSKLQLSTYKIRNSILFSDLFEFAQLAFHIADR